MHARPRMLFLGSVEFLFIRSCSCLTERMYVALFKIVNY